MKELLGVHFHVGGVVVSLVILVGVLAISNGERLVDRRINTVRAWADNLVFLGQHLINQLAGL